MRLRNKVVIVTGSTTGIGKAIALQCVQEGAHVVIHGLEQDWGNAVVAEIGNDKAVLHIEDVSKDDSHQKIVATAIKNFGKLDAVVNNAAWVVSSNVHTTDAAFFRKVLEINTIAPFLLIKAALPHLRETHGCILNIGSVNAYCGEQNLFAYSVSKGALMTLTKNLGDTLYREDCIRVNQINPGWVLTETEIKRKHEQGFPEGWYKNLNPVIAPAGRILLPKEIATAAIYWLSDESSSISGQVIDIEQFPFVGRNPPKDSVPIQQK